MSDMTGSDALAEARERIEALPPYAVRSSFAKPVRKYAGALSKAAVLSVLDALRAALDVTEPEPLARPADGEGLREALEQAWGLGYEQAVKDGQDGQRDMLDAPARFRANYRALAMDDIAALAADKDSQP